METIVQRHIGRLKGKVGWIIGGKRVGRVIARAFAEQGVDLILTYNRSAKDSEESAAEVKSLGRRAAVWQCDAADQSSVAGVVEKIKKEFGKLDVLIAMASVFDTMPMEKVTERDWDKNIGAHILGTFWPIQLAARIMPPGSHIITIADRTSVGPMYPNYLPYVVTKEAVVGLTRAAAKELGGRGIIANAIAPGPILPAPDFDREEWKKIRAASPLKIPIDDREAMEQFALLAIYLAAVTMTSGNVYSLDQGQNL
ncbi:MAG: SDR family oxidoreductase [Elusimicrobia bacterium]|nr:SDR family oxidoreductase [Elusimicrobiota bacterium]